MQSFEFDAPKYHNFFRTEKFTSTIEINPDNPDDMWFMQEHCELTPIKEKPQPRFSLRCDVKEEKEDEKSENFNEIEKEKVEALPNVDEVKETKLEEIKQKDEEKKPRNVANKKKRPAIGIAERFKRTNFVDKKAFNNIEVMTFGNRQNSSRSMKISQSRISANSNEHSEKEESFNNKLSRCKSELTVPNEKQKIRSPCPYPIKVQREWESKSQKNWYNLSKDSAEKAMKSMKKVIQNKKQLPKKEETKKRFKF